MHETDSQAYPTKNAFARAVIDHLLASPFETRATRWHEAPDGTVEIRRVYVGPHSDSRYDDFARDFVLKIFPDGTIEFDDGEITTAPVEQIDPYILIRCDG